MIPVKNNSFIPLQSAHSLLRYDSSTHFVFSRMQLTTPATFDNPNFFRSTTR